MNKSEDPLQKYAHLFTEGSLEISHAPEGWTRIIESFLSALEQYNSTPQWKPSTGFAPQFMSKLVNFIELFRAKTVKADKNFWTKSPNRSLAYNYLTKVLQFLRRYSRYEQTMPEPVFVEQIKEKFGTLRIYVSRSDDHVYGMVRLAEEMSSVTCEETGAQGSLCRKGKFAWYKTLSPEKAQELGYTKS